MAIWANFAKQDMRNLRNPQLERGEVRIEVIELDLKCKDDTLALLSGLQYLYSQEALRERILASCNYSFMDTPRVKRFSIGCEHVIGCVHLSGLKGAAI